MTLLSRLLFSGPFHAGQADRARGHVCARAASGARDLLYVVPNGAAGRAVQADLVRRCGAVFGVRVVSLAALPREIERRARVPSPTALDPLADELVVERAIREATGGAFEETTPVGGLTAGLLRNVDLLERSGASHEQLRDALARHGLSTEGARLLSGIWSQLAAARRQRARRTAARSRAESLAAAAALLRARPALLTGCDTVVIENVSLAAPLERQLIAALVAAAPGAVVAAYEAPPQLPDCSAARSLRSLRDMASWSEIACERTPSLFARALDATFAEPDPDSEGAPAELLPGARVTVLEAAGDVGEVRFAARVVRRHLQAGVVPGDVQIIVHGGARYHELVGEVFGFFGIPVALPHRQSAAECGVGQALLGLLELAIQPDNRSRREASLALARMPHLGFGPGQCDRLEHAVVTRGHLGVEGWDALDRALVGERTHARVTRLRQALGWAAEGFAALSRAEDAARLARAMAKELRLTSNLYFARRPALGAAGGADGASDGPRLRALTELAIREDNEAWEAIDDALDSVPSLLEMQGAPRALRGLRLAHAWRATLERALQARSVSGRFARRDAVRVGGSGAGACQPARVTIVLGLIEKLFPRQPRQDPFLRDDARRLLREEHGWQLPLSDEMMDEERACFLRAAASATDALYLACPATDAEGRQAVKSFFLEDLRRALDAPVEVERVGVSDLTPALGDAATPAELMATVSHDIWQHLPAGARFDTRRATAAAAYDTLRARRSDSDLDLAALTGARRPVMRPRFSRELFAGAPHETLLLSASQLGALGHCTYKHYVDKVLGPVPFVAPEHDPLDRGSLVHAAIVRWSLEFGGWQGGDEAAARADVWLSEEVGKWPPAKARSFRAKHEANRMREQLAELLGHERGLLAPSMARPEYSELAFGEELRESGLRDPASVTEMFDLPVRTATGELVVHLRGSIDRVDIIERGGRRYGVAYDYKTGKSSKYHARAMWQGHDLQLRLYLLALEHFWGVVPVGALYLGFGDRVRRGSVHADFADAIPGIASAPEKEVRRLDATAWEGFVRETPALIGQLVDRLVQLDIVAEPRDGDCGFCELGAVCRFDPHGLEMVDA